MAVRLPGNAIVIIAYSYTRRACRQIFEGEKIVIWMLKKGSFEQVFRGKKNRVLRVKKIVIWMLEKESFGQVFGGNSGVKKG